MPERRNPALQEAYWQGHSFEDNCPITTQQENAATCLVMCLTIPYIIPKAFLQVRNEHNINKKVYDELKVFLNLLPDSPIKKLTNGQIFDPKDYPVGTIVKLSWDSETANYMKLGIRWGMITQYTDNKDVAMTFSENRLNFDRLGGIGLPVEKEEIGKVEHFKWTDIKYQQLTRCNWVEIWHYGRGIRQRVPEKKSAIKRILKPA